MKMIFFRLIFITTFSACSSAYAATYDATIQFTNRITLSTSVSGIIKTVKISAGERIKKNQLMVALDKTPFEAAVTHAQAEVTINATRNKEAIRDFDQAQELYDRAVLSNVELENAKLKAERAKANHDAAQARLTQMTYNFDHASISAPFDGWVLKVHVAEGESINSSEQSPPLVTLASSDSYTARTQVTSSLLTSLKIGKTALISVNDKQFSGKITAIYLEPSKQGRDNDVMHDIDIKFTAPAQLHAGQAARVEFP